MPSRTVLAEKALARAIAQGYERSPFQEANAKFDLTRYASWVN